jgi:hypothetical protein
VRLAERGPRVLLTAQRRRFDPGLCQNPAEGYG